MSGDSWLDLNQDGRRLNRIIKQMYSKAQKAEDPALEMAYIDRAIKATNSKFSIAEEVLGIKAILQESRKSLPKPQVIEVTK